MALPATPATVDDVGLSVEQLAWLANVIAIIHAVDPTRAASAILEQALGSYRKAHQVRGGRWVRRSVIQLGGDVDGGKVLALPPEESPDA